MRIAILGKNSCWHSASLAEAFKNFGIKTCLFSPRTFLAYVEQKSRVKNMGEILDLFDAVVVRSMPGGSLEQVIFRMDVLHNLEGKGVKIFNNPRCIEKTVDKYYTSSLLAESGIPTPKTVVTEKFDEAMAAFNIMGDIIVKPLFGSMGRGIVRINDEDTAYRVFKAWQACRYVYYIQEFIPHDNRDIRVFVIGERVVASMVRSNNSWKTNINRGAKARAIKIDSELEKLCLKVTAALDADYLGIDILINEKGDPYIIEANSIPGWKGLQSTTKNNIAEDIAGYILQRTRS